MNTPTESVSALTAPPQRKQNALQRVNHAMWRGFKWTFISMGKDPDGGGAQVGALIVAPFAIMISPVLLVLWWDKTGHGMWQALGVGDKLKPIKTEARRCLFGARRFLFGDVE